ncbi:MAG: DUF4920 domain-containing protein [Ginsengibacter sp.]
MKKILLTLFVLSSIHCGMAQVTSVKDGSSFGEKIVDQTAINIKNLENILKTQKQFSGNAKGKVVSVCQEKGCWMKLESGGGETVMVRFKDYKFFVPKNIAGRDVVLTGVAERSVTSVETLKHYAADAGKTSEEIEKIKAPKSEIVFIASGVMVK